MPAPQFFPISPELLALACETVSRRFARLPFMQDGISVTRDLIGLTLECLNAGPSKTLAITVKQTPDNGAAEGLDRCLEQRLEHPVARPCVTVIAAVLCSAGIAERAEVISRISHARSRGLRLLPAWTWHCASAPVPFPLPAAAETAITGSPAPWMCLCPVCRTGILNRVAGTQLFGIPHIDYYIGCTHCGAKFIPIGEQFCLVSIATILDPLRKRYLNRSFSAESWAEIARGSSPGPAGRVRVPASPRPSPVPRELNTGALIPMKDGSLGVPVLAQTLYFRPARLIFSGRLKENIFSKEQRIVRDVISTPAYSHLQAMVNERYAHYLPLRVGLFLWERKEKRDLFYREFLNPWGDEKYGTFMPEESSLAGRKGVYLVVAGGRVCHAGCSHESFTKTLNGEFSRIIPGDCYRERDGTRCRINALLCTQKKTAGVYLHAVDDREERVRIIEALANLPPAGTP